MLEPKNLTNLEKNRVVELYGKLSIDLIHIIIKKLQSKGDISSFTKSQIRTLAKIDGKEIYKQTIIKLNEVDEKKKRELIRIYQEVAIEEMNGYKKQYEYANIPFELSREQRQLIETNLNRTNKTLSNLTKTVAFISEETYVNALDNLYTKVATGAFSYDKAIKNVVNDLANKGITLTSKGREYKLESAVKTNLMTSLTHTANEISKKTGKIIGADAVWIAPTPFCRPTHRPINGVVLSIKEFQKLEYLTEEPNCYHIVNYVIKDIFDIPYTKSELKNINKNADKKYEARQKQNYYARQVRNKKEEIVNLKNTNSTSIINEKKKELRVAQMKYRTFSKANNLEIDYNSLWKQGYNK